VNAPIRETAAVAAVVAADPDLETEKSIEERADASTARERATWLETAERKAEATAETAEEAEVEAEEIPSKGESESLSAQIQAGSEMTPATPVRWTKIEKIE